MPDQFKREITIMDKYGPAMTITDPAEAARYFELCVEHTQIFFGKPREIAEEVERSNLGSFAGYYDHETRRRVERLFRCVHPFLGPAREEPTEPTDVLLLGIRLGMDLKGGTRRG